MSNRKPASRRGLTAAASGLLALICALLLVFAVTSPGYPVRRVSLHDGGIWVTSNKDGLYGRLNKPIRQLDAGFFPPGGAQGAWQIDVLQNENWVVAVDTGKSRLMPVDTTRAGAATRPPTNDNDQIDFPAGYLAALGGTSVGLLDSATGKLWAARVEGSGSVASLSGLNPSEKPRAELKAGAADVAVGLDGTVYAASAANHKLISLAQAGDGLAAPKNAELNASLRSVQVTAVGSKVVELDPQSGVVSLGGKTVTVPGVSADKRAVAQQPGPAADDVLIAAYSGLYAVGFDGTLRTVYGTAADAPSAQAIGAPGRPVRLGPCVHGVWNGTPGTYVQACGGQPGSKRDLPTGSSLEDPVFRINRDQIVLNDRVNGGVWDIDSSPEKVDNWNSLKAPPKQQPNKNPNKNPAQQLANDNRPPVATPDKLGARPGRTTVLHLMDNDSDPDGDVLAITNVTQPKGATVSIAPDGQTAQIALGDDARGSLSFKYTISDGKGQSSQPGDVTIEVRTGDVNVAPVLRHGYQPPKLTVVAGGTIGYPALSDWRDYDGDPLVLTEATVKDGGGTPSITEDGRVVFVAGPAAAASVRLDYKVTDNNAPEVAANPPLSVRVLDRSGLETVAPIAQPDVIRAIVGQPAVIRPLANDIPGSDPTDERARLTLAAQMAARGGALVTTDLAAGTVTVRASKPGTVMLSYLAAFGSAKTGTGTIRVDADPAPSSTVPPVAMPDTAVLHGQQSITMDPLANDYAPSGGVLVVQFATPLDSALRVGIVKGHWLRIESASATSQGSHIVRYTITDGLSAPVVGQVAVTQRPRADRDSPPVAQNDRAIVRAGDAVTIAVLNNDTDADGDSLSLLPSPITVSATDGSPNAGTAAVAGNAVRFGAPAAAQITAPVQVTFNYLVADPAGATAQGTVSVTVNTRGDAEHDQPPTPAAVESNAVAGDTLTINIPVTGVDPDGDSVTVTGITSAPKLGRITKINATSLVYQSYPLSAGTDSLTYQVTDPYGQTGSASIRIGLVPPGDLQPPLAVADTISAAPGTTVQVAVLSNDFFDARSTSIVALDKTNKALPAGVKLTDDDKIVIPVPANAVAPIVVSYAITEGFGLPSRTQVTVQPRDSFNNPPVARDDFPTLKDGDTSVTVDVLANDDDPDGPVSDLKLAGVWSAGVTAAGSKLTIALQDNPFTVAYRVTDKRGGSSVGYVHVPAKADGSGPPHLRPGVAPIQIDKNATKTVNLADYVIDPAGKKLQLTTTDTFSTSPVSGLSASSKSATALTVRGQSDYIGPAAVTVEVTNGTSLQDPNGQRAVVTIPVQVGPGTPVFRCPPSPIVVQQGGVPQSVNLFQLCHIWTASDADADALNFSRTWDAQVKGVELSGSGAGNRMLVLNPTNSAAPGATGSVTVSADGTNAKGTVKVAVVKAAPLTVSPVVLRGIKEGQATRVDLADYITSPLAKPDLHITQLTKVSGMDAASAIDGTAVSVTPGAKTHGQMVFRFAVTDIAGNAERIQNSTITIEVLGRPDAPGTPVKVSEGNRTVVVSFTTPAANGAPIDRYELKDRNGATYACPASPCTVTGLKNGSQYQFSVRAHNLVNWSDPSGQSGVMTPDALPGPVTSLTATPGDKQATVSWMRPQNEGSEIKNYNVQISPDPGSGSIKTVTGNTVVFGGLINGVNYSFRIRANNGKGAGPFGGSAPAIPFGKPATPAAATANGVDTASSTQAIAVSWPPADGNGRSITGYTVTGSSSAGKKLGPVAVSGTSTSFNVDNDGTSWTFSYTATNAGKLTSAPSPASNSVRATATPDQMADPTVKATGGNGQLRVDFRVADPHGATATVKYSVNGGAAQTWGAFPTGSAQSRVVSGLTNGSNYTIAVMTCNEAGQCGGAGSGSGYPWGPMNNPTVSGSVNDRTINWTWNGDCNGQRCHLTWHDNKGHACNSGCAISGNWNSPSYGYSTTVTFTVNLISDEGQGTKTDSASARTVDQPPNPTLVPSLGKRYTPTAADPTCNYYGGGRCPRMKLTIADITHGTYTVRCYHSTDGKFGADWTLTYNGGTQVYNDDNGTEHCYEGYPGTVWFTLSGPDSYESDHIAW
jgi:hypothetical protein